jgi:protein gp37
MGKTSISWTNKTWNVIRGCRRKSDGCRNCYAERQAIRFAGAGGPYEGLVETKLRIYNNDEHDPQNRREPRWTGKIKFVDEVLDEPLRWKKPCMVFVNAMSDLFFEDLPFKTIAMIYGVMAACPQHTFQILTKRSARMREFYAWVEIEAKACNDGVGMTPAAYCFVLAQKTDTYFKFDGSSTPMRRSEVVNAALTAAWPLPNVWLGISAENQECADERIPDLLKTPATVRWVSLEPLLGDITLEYLQLNGEVEINALAGTYGVTRPHRGQGEAKLDWVVAGCESGPGRRTCDVQWLRDLRDQCARAGTPYFLKQAIQIDGQYMIQVERPLPEVAGRVGELVPVIAGGSGSREKGRNLIETPYLDGKQHVEFPRV